MKTETLDDLNGLESAKRFIRTLFSPESSVHAVLLYGSEGSGKSTLARMLSNAWVCQSPTLEGGCGECRPCGAFLRSQSTDFLPIVPQGATRIIPLGAISETSPRLDSDPPLPLQTFLRTGPLISRSKVVLIEDADRLNHRAANSLLKTLEEPQGNIRLVLTTSQISLVLTTIVSRCVCVACEMPKVFAEAHALTRMADGSPGILKELERFAEFYTELDQFAEELSGRRPEEALATASEFRSWCEQLDNKRKLGARAANAEGLRLLSRAFSASPGSTAQGIQLIVEAHRRVAGNANSILTTDTLFAELLAR